MKTNQMCSRLVSLSILVAMIFMTFTNSISALATGSNITVNVIRTDGTGASAPILTATIANADVEKTYSYQWYKSKTVDGVYAEVLHATNLSYVLENNDCESYFKMKITEKAQNTVATEIWSEPFYVNQMGIYYEFGNIVPGNVGDTVISSDNINTYKKANASDKFSYDGKTYILLNEYTDSNSAFYVLADCYMGNYTYDSDRRNKFGLNTTLDENSSNIAFYINSSGFQNGLPQAIKSNIDYNHEWYTECGSWDSGLTKDQSKDTMGIGLLSVTEFLKYYNKLGFDDPAKTGNWWNDNVQYWWLRSQQSSWAENSKALAVVVNESHDKYGQAVNMDSGSWQELRPSFYLKEDFFKNVKLDVSTIGENVKKVLATRYTEAELASVGYTNEEIKAITGDHFINASLGFYAEEGNLVITECQPGDMIEARFKTQITVASTTASIYVAYYNSEEELMNISLIENYQMNKTGDNEYVGTIIGYKVPANATVGSELKAFAWENNLKPIINLAKVTVIAPVE